MRSFRFGRAVALAPILLTALASSGCPWLNHQPDYLGEKNSLMSVPDPLPATDAPLNDGGSPRPKAGVFDHASISISQEGGLSDQARRAQ